MNPIRAQIEELVKKFFNCNFQPEDFIPGVTQIAVTKKLINAEELINIVNAALDGCFTTDRFNSSFERKLENFLTVKKVLTVNSGSSANLTALSSLASPQLENLKINKGDEVITVACGFPTTINPIIQIGATPVFVDIELGTYNVDIKLLKNAITSRTKAIVLAHTLGNPFNLDAISQICKQNDLFLVEDCCDALGSKYDGRPVGTFGDFSTLSFYPAHHITMGEGGAVCTNNLSLARIAMSIRDWGRDCYCKPGKDNTCGKRFGWCTGSMCDELPSGYDHKYIYSNLGYNLKITDMQAACGLAQLAKLQNFCTIRRSNFQRLYHNLSNLENFIHLPQAENNSDPSWFGFPITLKGNLRGKRALFIEYLNTRKIHTRLLFAGNVTKQPYMRHYDYRISGTLTTTDTVMNDSLWVGIHPSLSGAMLDYMSEAISLFCKTH